MRNSLDALREGTHPLSPMARAAVSFTPHRRGKRHQGSDQFHTDCNLLRDDGLADNGTLPFACRSHHRPGRHGTRSAHVHRDGGRGHADRMPAGRHPEIFCLQRRIRVSIAGDRPGARRHRPGAPDRAAEPDAFIARPAHSGLHHGHPCAEQPAELRSAALCDHDALCLPFVDSDLCGAAPRSALVERTPAPAAAGRCAPRSRPPQCQQHQRLLPEEATFRDATRIEQILTASGASPSNDHIVDETMHCFDQAAALRQCSAELDRLGAGPLADAAIAARTALAQRDGNEMLTAARTLREAAAQHDVCADPACAALVLASVVATAQPASRSIERKLP